MRALFIVLALASLALLFTNPGMDDFSRFAESRSEEMLTDRLGESALGRAASRFGSSLAGDLVPEITERTNFYLFSLYQIGDSDDGDVDHEASADDHEPWRFLGIAGRFFQLSGPKR